MDRIFRSTKDFILTQEDLDKRGIMLEIGDCAFCSDPNNPFYRAMIVMMSQFAEMESRRLSYRIKEAFARRDEADADHRSTLPAGIKRVRIARTGYGEKPLCFREWNVWERSLMNAICQKADLENWTCREVTEWMNNIVLRNERTRLKDKSCWMKYPLTEKAVLRMYFWEKVFRLYGITNARATRHDRMKWEYGKPTRTWAALQRLGWLPLPE
jgi:hypothetical protein